MGIDKSKGSAYDLDPNSPHNTARPGTPEVFEDQLRKEKETNGEWRRDKQKSSGKN